jgi:DNA-binding transcriptional ArsR family regulator
VTRLRLVQRLAASPATVTELIAHVDLSQPLVSWHLRTLRAAGLIETRRSGREVICSLRRDAFARYMLHQRDLLEPVERDTRQPGQVAGPAELIEQPVSVP